MLSFDLFLMTTGPAIAAEPEVSVSVTAGGLARAATILTARHGTTINFEGVPRTTTAADGTVVARPGPPGDFAFTYSSTATSRTAADAAVAAWNRLAVDAHYRVVESDHMLHFVPTEVREPGGSYVPYAPLMDTVLHLDRVTGQPTELYREMLRTLSATAGVPVNDACSEFTIGALLPDEQRGPMQPDQASVTLPSADGSARALFDALLAAAGEETNWLLLWVPGVSESALPGWSFGFDTARPESEAEFNRTPLLPAAVRP